MGIQCWASGVESIVSNTSIWEAPLDIVDCGASALYMPYMFMVSILKGRGFLLRRQTCSVQNEPRPEQLQVHYVNPDSRE